MKAARKRASIPATAVFCGHAKANGKEKNKAVGKY